MAGRVVLINSVLNAVSLYSLSFYKAPKKVLKDIVAIQRNFLWGGCEIRKTVNWVSWDTICKTREEGGLGVKNVEIMNVALLSKWKWRILMEKEAVWRDLLEARYGNVKVKVLIGDISVVGKKDSIWWRDILISDNYENLDNNHFAGAIECKVWSGNDIPFWYACWTGPQTLMEAYPELYRYAENHHAVVSFAGSMINGTAGSTADTRMK
ncbi:uncharacterized mitochondrial protein AtMg00310-like [Vicia villosa]|uniref:uncharacterized mitochondrial protein AtMg00310-like n=1 Tax=Vicia villosa TaxID=3911 RepID=UPI00273B1A57|nr:uncharacterized mitochondrial protein AtMg00310-like [Vicia villosa]